MGRIKSGMIKKAAQQLYEQMPEFNESFENNKKLLKKAIHYKSVRNKVAGGIVRLVREEKEKEIKEKKRVEREEKKGSY